MKQNELTSNIANVVDNCVAIAASNYNSAAGKVAARAIADNLINHFGKDFASLQLCITQEFAALDGVGYFGSYDKIPGKTYSQGSKTKQAAIRWYERSFAAAHPKYKLKGCCPCMISPATPKAKQSPEEQIEKVILKCGGNATTAKITQILVKNAIAKAKKEQVESDKAAKIIATKKAEKEASIAAEKRGLQREAIIAGMTAAELQEMFHAKQELEKAQSSC